MAVPVETMGRIQAYIAARTTFDRYESHQGVAAADRAEVERFWNRVKAEFDAMLGLVTT